MGLVGEIIAEINTNRCSELFQQLLDEYQHSPEITEALTRARDAVLVIVAD